MFDNLLIIARCDVWCVGLGRLVVERWKEGRGGRGENRGYGQRWQSRQSQLINPRCACAQRGLYIVVVVCVCVCVCGYVCVYVCVCV